MAKGSWAWGALLLALATAACDNGQSGNGQSGSESPAGVVLSDARVQLPAVAGRPGVAYVAVGNRSSAARTITAVEVAGAGRSELHATRHEGAVSTMAPAASVPLGPGETVRFAPGGLHVMLFDLDPALKAGGTTPLTVTFADGGEASVDATVTGAGGGGGATR